MPELKVTNIAGEQSTIEVDAGQTLMEALRDNAYDEIEAVCGGGCACATCHVYIDAAWLDKLEPRSDDEEMVVSSVDNFKDNSRLSCQVTLSDELDGMAVIIADQDW